MTRRLLSALTLALTLTLVRADPPKPEFRGAWVATVANIDWPSKPGLPAEQQKKELVAILDRCQAIHLNAVVFQVRPMCDALYESKLEPWSSFLTGEQGKSPGYDPLAFAIEEAHKRGLELHAWFNPYRAWSPAAKGEPAATHPVKTRPDLAKKYGKHYWLNPTSPAVQDHSLRVILDVVRRYGVDGVHMDDYFYPYPELDEAKQEIPFPDDDTWAAYQKAGGKLARDDWRRDAVNTFVKTLYTEVHTVKPRVLVGISPFGIWRPGHPEGIAGFDQYAKLYADARLWLREGWVDYFTPQLYWPIAQQKQSYPKLLAWWAGENPKGRHLWVGNSSSRHGPAELVAQVRLTRAQAGAGPSAGRSSFTNCSTGCSTRSCWTRSGALSRSNSATTSAVISTTTTSGSWSVRGRRCPPAAASLCRRTCPSSRGVARPTGWCRPTRSRIWPRRWR
jgi:uncharacterized lipoprotein YddW (UPF0748 family)